MRLLDRLIAEEMVHPIGVSAMAAWKLTKGLWTSDFEGLERFEVTPPRFNAAERPEDYHDVCSDQYVAVCP